MSKTVKFLGKRYSVERVARESKLFWLDPPGSTYSGLWEAGTHGRLVDMTSPAMVRGNTARRAVNALEKRLFRDFAELGELLGWEVER